MRRRRIAGRAVLASLVALAALLALGRAAAQVPAAPSALARYDLAQRGAAHWSLPRRLAELSGLAATADGRLLAHQDERAVIHEVDLRRGRIVKSFSLGRPVLRGDFEGIAVVDGRLFLATSDGLLYESREGAAGASMPVTRHDTGLGARCELEGLGVDTQARALLLACKQCRSPALCGFVTVFRWSLDRRAVDPAGPLLVPLATVVRGTSLRSFHPSAIEQHPGTHNYLLLAGREHAIAEITPAGAVVSVVRLPRRWHRQAEGLAVTRELALLLGSEGNGRDATLSLYPYRH